MENISYELWLYDGKDNLDLGAETISTHTLPRIGESIELETKVLQYTVSDSRPEKGGEDDIIGKIMAKRDIHVRVFDVVHRVFEEGESASPTVLARLERNERGYII